MIRLNIVVEGQTEQEFVKSVIAPYLSSFGINSVTPILIRTSKTGKGGFVNYQHLKNDIQRLLHNKTDAKLIVTMFVDFFRMPTNIPNYTRCIEKPNRLEQVIALEDSITSDITDSRFIPYIQLHEFEALLFSSNNGFETYFEENIYSKTNSIIVEYPNPEDINTTPEGAPSKRILSIKPDYDKVVEGNLIALEVGMNQILEKCPRFKAWIESLVKNCREE